MSAQTMNASVAMGLRMPTMHKGFLGSSCPFLPISQTGAVRAPRSVVVEAKKRNSIAGVSYDKNEPQYSPLTSAFTRRREVFVGRLAMSGFLSAVIGELITGKGALGQLRLETSLPQNVVNWLVAGVVIFNVLTALNPASPTFSEENQRDVRKRPKGPTQDPRIDPSNPVKFFGISPAPGFTKKNELAVGRVAMLGFASELIGEILTGGKGPLGQIGVPIGQPLNSEVGGFALAVWIGFWAFAAVGFNNFGQQEGDEEIY